ncbi:Ccdc38 [Symbiodinium natans]|uniref:Ccdc38 protein n=1 Tax=Symbiodinium natans TaxID=878477 RepID=A0A812TRI1_9DINO|nr:Ccdc38 [Symbiodinium natans]
MGATASVEAPSADDLKRLYDKHDITGSGHLEKQEAFALLEDLRIRYGMDEELPESFKEAVFQDFDKDNAGTWSWHDVRVLSGEGWPAMRRRLQRLRVRGGQRHNRAQRQKEQTLGESAASAWSKVSGAGAAVAALKEVEAVRDLEEEVQLDFHPLRIQNISIGQEAWTFAPAIDLRVIRGDPRRGRAAPNEVNQAVFEGPFVARIVSGAPRGTTQDPTWSESLQLSFMKAKGLYIHVVLSDNRFGVGLGPLAELVVSLGEVLDMMRSPSVSRFTMQPFSVDLSKVNISPPVVLVAQFGGPRPSLHCWCHVIRAEALPEETFVVEASLIANQGQGCVLVRGRSDPQSGPDPVYHNSVNLDWDDEGDMAFNCQVIRTGIGFSEEVFAELKEKLPQALVAPVGRSQRLELRCLDGSGTNAELSVHFATVMPEMSLSITAASATCLAPKSEAWSFNPFVEATVQSRDPRLGSVGRSAKVTAAQTETLTNCHADPHWTQPMVLKLVPEPGLFLRIVVCSEALGVTRAWDELAELVMELPEALKLAQGSVERKFTLTRLIDMKRHGESEIFLSFAQVGGNVSASAFEAGHDLPLLEGGVRQPQVQVSIDGSPIGAKSRHPTLQRPIAAGYSLPPQPSVQGMQHLGQVLQAHSQEVPDIIAQRYGPPQQPRFQDLPPPPAPRQISSPSPEELTQALQQAPQGAIVKGNVPLSFFNTPNPHLAWIARR